MKRGKLLDHGLVAVVAIALALAVQAFVVKPYRIPSESMASTLRPGDTLQVKDGRLWVNGHPVKEPDVHRTGGSVDPTRAEHPLYGSTMREPWSLGEPYTVPSDHWSAP